MYPPPADLLKEIRDGFDEYLELTATLKETTNKEHRKWLKERIRERSIRNRILDGRLRDKLERDMAATAPPSLRLLTRNVIQ